MTFVQNIYFAAYRTKENSVQSKKCDDRATKILLYGARDSFLWNYRNGLLSSFDCTAYSVRGNMNAIQKLNMMRAVSSVTECMEMYFCRFDFRFVAMSHLDLRINSISYLILVFVPFQLQSRLY